MIIVTSNDVPGKRIVEIRGFAQGNIVQSKNIGRDFMSGLKSIVGGEITAYTEMMSEARTIAMERMEKDAKALGANAIVAVRLETASLVQGTSEVMAYGTAVIVE